MIGLDYIYSKGGQGLLIYQDPIALFVKENWHMKLMTTYTVKEDKDDVHNFSNLV